MEVIKSFIKAAVGILLVVAVCLVMVTLYRKGNESISSSIKKYDSMMASAESLRYEEYLGNRVSGSEVIGLITSLGAGDNISITVANKYSQSGRNTTTYTYETIHAAGSTLLSNMRDDTIKSDYINPRAYFKGTAVYDDNGVLSGLSFVQN